MIIDGIILTPKIKSKIYKKHKVTAKEIKIVLSNGNPYFRKVKSQYVAIGKFNRYLTIFFNYDKERKQAEVRTAYPSSKWQIKMYKRAKGGK